MNHSNRARAVGSPRQRINATNRFWGWKPLNRCLILAGIGYWAITAALPSLAQSTDTTAPPAAIPAAQAVAAAASPVPLRAGLRFHSTGPGTDPFTSLDSFVPLFQTPGRQLTFLQGRFALTTDNGALGGGLLLGHRFYDVAQDRVYGGYLGYDIRSTGGSPFHQLGMGLEMLGDRLEVRVNGYLPVGKTRQLLGESLPGTGFFAANWLRLDRSRQFETAMGGLDLEVGTRLASWTSNWGSSQRPGSLRGYAGMYYLNAQGDRSTLGIKGRLEARPTEDFSINLILSHDGIFDTRATVGLLVNLPGPFSQTKPHSPQLQPPANLGAWVERQPTIAIDQRTINDSIIALNPQTNQPYFFQHVNLGLGNGTGTFETPFGTVADAIRVARANDIIYVQSGTNVAIPAFTLPNGVTLLSTGPVQRLDTVQLAGVVLPLSGSGIYPTIADATAASLVTLGNDNRVAGFTIQNARENGIFGSNIRNPNLQDNRILNAARSGILLENVSGTATVSRSVISNSGDAGVLVQNRQGAAQLTIQDNQLTNNRLGLSIGLANTAQAEAQIARNVIAQGSLGIDLQLRDTAQLTTTIQDNQIRQTQFDGLILRSLENTRATITVTNNDLGDIQDSAINIEARNNAEVNGTINNNTIQNTAGQGIFYEAFNASRGNLAIANNTIRNVQDSGIDLDLSDQANLTIDIRNNSLTNTRFDSLFIKASQSAQVAATVANNQIRNSQDNGIAVSLADQSRGSVTLNNNQVEGTTFDSVLIETTQNAQATLRIGSNSLASLLTNVAGFNLNARNFSRIQAGVEDNTITNSSTFGSTFQAAENAVLCLQLKNNRSDRPINLTGIDASTFQAENTLSTNITPTLNQTGTVVIVPPGTCQY